jgi:hypothetical protein
LNKTKRSSIGKSLRRGLVGALGLILCFSVGAFAQSDNSQLSGFVKDSSGAVIPGVTVMVSLEGQALQRTAVTDSRGYYVIAPLPPGYYTAAVEQPGFKRSETTHKKLDPGIPGALDIVLQVGGTNETVTVTANTAVVQTESATVGKLVEGTQLQYLGLNGRNPIFLAGLMPGVNTDLTGNNYGSNTPPSMNGSSLGMIFFDGMVGVRTRNNGTWSIGAADLDATQEVQVLTANFSAEYGRTAGGQIRVVTKGGSNKFHGSAYDYIRNSAFNANSWSRNNSVLQYTQPCTDPANKSLSHCRPAPFRYNQYGWNVSGPVMLPFTNFNRDNPKLFFTFNQEWVHSRSGSTSTLTMASDAMRQGNFNELLDPTNRYFQRAVYLKDPQKSGSCSATNQTACFNYNGIINYIPPSRQSRNGMAFMNSFPKSMGWLNPYPSSTNWMSGELAGGTNQGKTTIGADYVPTPSHSIRVRGQFFNSKPPDAVTDYRNQFYTYPCPSCNTWRDRPNRWVSINWTWSLSAKWVNEMLAGFSHDFVDNILDLRGNAWDRTKFGIDYPYIFPGNEKEVPNKLPTVSGVGGISGISSTPYPATSAGPIWQFSDNMSLISGRHSIKFGVYVEKSGENDKDQIIIGTAPGSTNNQNGQFQFSDNTPNGTGNSLGNMAIGLFNTYAEVGARSYTQFRSWDIEMFFQDAWKVTSKLKVEMGLRYSLIQPYFAMWNNMSNFDPSLYDPNNAATVDPSGGWVTGTLAQRYNGMVFSGEGWPDAAKGPGRVIVANTGEFDFLFRPGTPKGFYKMHKKDFQPRFGIAYAFNQKTVLRAGGGRFINRLGVSDGIFLGGNPPLQPQYSISNGLVDNPGGSGGVARDYPLNPSIQSNEFPNPESWAWNATFQREIPFATTVEIAYVGRKSLRSTRTINNINQLQAGAIYDPANFLPGTTKLKNLDSLRPYKGFGLLKMAVNNQNSIYHSLQIQANRRFSKGLSFGLSYTYAVSNSNSLLTDIYDWDGAYMWGIGSPSHNLVIHGIYEIPFLRNRQGVIGKAFGGWSITAITQLQRGSGMVSFTDPYDDIGLGGSAGTQYMILTGNPYLPKDQRTYGLDGQFFNTKNPDGSAIVARPAQGTYCKTGCARSIQVGASWSQEHNLSFSKDFRIREGQRLTVRGEIFNWPNHPEWGSPDTNWRSSTFGKVTSKSSNTREMQLSLRFSF